MSDFTRFDQIMENLKLMFYFLYFIFTIKCSSSPDYGPFQLHITKLDMCAGPRNKNCTFIDPTETVLNGGILGANFKVLDNVIPSKGKVVASSNGKELIRLQMNKPCEHLFLRPLFERMFKVSKNCMILKGEYGLKLNMEEMMESYFGGQFFYGNVNFKAVVYGNDCNFSCTKLYLTISPKH